MGLFSFLKKRSKHYSFSDEDRILAAQSRAYRAKEMLMKHNLEMAKYETDIAAEEFEREKYLPEEDSSDNPFDAILEKIGTQIIEQKIPHLMNSVSPKAQNTPQISDAIISKALSEVSPIVKKHMKTLPDEELIYEIKTLYPEATDDIANRAISLLRAEQ